MSASSFLTRFSLPPGLLSRELVRELFRLVFQEFRWFTPAWYGKGEKENPAPEGDKQIDVFADYYESFSGWKSRWFMVEARTGEDFLFVSPACTEYHPYIGDVIWTTSASSTLDPAWRARQAVQCVQLMRLLECPLVISALSADYDRKEFRLVTDEGGRSATQVINVRDYSEGLPGLFWRNFYGPLFLEMFGERLAAVPEAYRRDMGGGIVLVEPYPLPADAETEAGQAREKELIALLGPECFYDHERHLKPTHRPNLPPPPPEPRNLRPIEGYHLWVVYPPSPRIDLPAIAAALRAQGLTVTSTDDHLDVTYPGAQSFCVLVEPAERAHVVAEHLRARHPAETGLARCGAAIRVEFDDLDAALDEVNTLIDIQLALQTLTGGYLYVTWNGELTPPES